jgi:hypothetical protein
MKLFCRLQLYFKGAAIWQKINAPVVIYKGIINVCNNHFLIIKKKGMFLGFSLSDWIINFTEKI